MQMPHESRGTDRTAFFDHIYATDLTYVPDCYKLCGDAHCCNYTRYKQQFVFGRKQHSQELPLLPGELEYLTEKNFLGQFEDYSVREVDFPIAQGVIRYRAIVSKRRGCACNHETRPAACRLYPLFPQYDVSGAVVGVEDGGGIYDDLERIGRLPRACQVSSVPVGAMSKFIALAAHLGSDPIVAFHMEAFRMARAAAAASVEAAVGTSGRSVFRTFETLLLRSQLFDVAKLRADLEALCSRFAARHGDRFRLP